MEISLNWISFFKLIWYISGCLRSIHFDVFSAVSPTIYLSQFMKESYPFLRKILYLRIAKPFIPIIQAKYQGITTLESGTYNYITFCSCYLEQSFLFIHSGVALNFMFYYTMTWFISRLTELLVMFILVNPDSCFLPHIRCVLFGSDCSKHYYPHFVFWNQWINILTLLSNKDDMFFTFATK